MRSRLIRVGSNGSRKKVILNMVIDGTDAVSAELVPPEADALIEQLGFARASLEEPVTADLKPHEELGFAVVDPAWKTSTEIMSDASRVDGLSLALRHPGYGWLCFLLPHKEAKALGAWLVEHAKADPSKPLEPQPDQAGAPK